jgi:hypothetical protein
LSRTARSRIAGVSSSTVAQATDAALISSRAICRASCEHWEGLARFAEAESLAEMHGGTARRVAATAPAPQSNAVAAAGAE